VDVVTDPQHRQQGYATELLCQIFAWAQRAGAGDATLQVQGDNAAARALYTRLGFREAYAYWYRVRHLADDEDVKLIKLLGD
jgi:ribosomal protein S18 acetylase RimI-like enzyme